MPLDFTGKTAVVTGAANGIGLATARALAAGGADVWILDLERERPAEVAAGFNARGLPVDVTDRAGLDAAFDRIGAPDILVANAGVVIEQEFFAYTREAWDRTIAVNLTGVFQTLQAAAPCSETTTHAREMNSVLVSLGQNCARKQEQLFAAH